MNDIKLIRVGANLTQAAFSTLLDIPLRTIEDWESGRRKPPEYVVQLIKFRINHKEEDG